MPLNAGALELPRQRMRTGLTMVGYGWALLSLMAAVMVSAGYYMPMWLVGALELDDKRLEAFFGCFRRCNYPVSHPVTKRLELVEICGRYRSFSDIPSVWWQIATVTAGLGSACALLAAFIVLPSCCVRDIISRTSARILGVLQVLAAILVIVGCILYPLGWDNKEVRDACGSSVGPYLLGYCTVGWAFYLVLGGAMLLLVCGSLSTRAGHPLDWHRLKNAEDHSLLKSAHV